MAAECELMRWIVDKEIVPLYIDTAKSFAALSSGALALSIVFREKIVGTVPGRRVDAMMVTSWVLYLMTLGASAIYQYAAVRFLDSVSCWPAIPSNVYQWLVETPGYAYGAMLVLFFAASAMLVIAAVRQIPKNGTH